MELGKIKVMGLKMKRSVQIMIVVLVLYCLATYSYKVDGTSSSAISKEEDLEMETQLNLINKPPLKTIQAEFGHIVDCIDVKKQLAFDHPLLNNHRLQRKPSFIHRRSKRNNEDGSASVLGLHKDLCPKGTVSIRRTTKRDLIGAKSFSTNYHNFPPPNDIIYNTTHFAVLYTPNRKGVSYYGVNGIINVYTPRVERNQMSLVQIGVQNGVNQINTILTGWQVFPQVYEDEGDVIQTHIFAAWTTDALKKTGCLNMQCPGFVQIDKRFYLGMPIPRVSTYNGTQYETSFSITQDGVSKNWWVIVEGVNVGYYPAQLFTNMTSAEVVGWGGWVSSSSSSINGSLGSSPEMGSGHIPDGNFKHACFIRRISFLNAQRSIQPPTSDVTNTSLDNQCYNLQYYGFKDDHYGHTLQLGGPAGANCSLL